MNLDEVAWIPQGPGSTRNGQVENVVPNNEVVGAIHAVAAHPTNSAASDKIFVSGQSGVFAMLTNDRGVWSEFGLELPNALVRDLDYDAADDVLVVGTLGRGAWLLPNANEVRALEGSPLLWVPTLMTP